MLNNDWDVAPEEAVRIQNKLKSEVRLAPLLKKPKTIAGVDVSMNLYEDDLYAGIIVLSLPDLEVLEEVTVKTKTKFPYIPGLLSFREIPALLECVKKLSITPDVYMVDGQGIAHPRRLGIAAHLGVILGTPSIGCAKSRLYGEVHGESLLDPKTGEAIGAVITTKPRTNPIIISPGNLITLRESVEIVHSVLRGYKLPEPTRRAHLLVNEFRKNFLK